MPRKTGAAPARAAVRPRASMRPRPDAAENAGRPARPATTAGGFNEAAARCRGKHEREADDTLSATLASMRPRPDAAENAGPRAVREQRVDASMRPRPDAAENPVEGDVRRLVSRASMRPRPDAAENAGNLEYALRLLRLQ